jgi:hypothetical protein
MSNVMIAAPERPRGGLHIALWLAQGFLAFGFAMTGLVKVTTPIAELATQMPWVASLPLLVRFIGVLELAGALGLILPTATGIKPVLTPLIASLVVVLMLLAAALHLLHGTVQAVPVNIILGAIAAFIVWGRLVKAPVPART